MKDKIIVKPKKFTTWLILYPIIPLTPQNTHWHLFRIPLLWWGIGVSFFDTEKFHAVMPAKGTDRGGRSAPQDYPSSLNMDVSIGDRRPPGSSVTSRISAPASFGRKKRHPYPSWCNSCGVKAIIGSKKIEWCFGEISDCLDLRKMHQFLGGVRRTSRLLNSDHSLSVYIPHHSRILCYFLILVKRRMRRKLLIFMIAIVKHDSLRPRMGSRRTPPKSPPKKPPKRSAP